MYFTNLNSSLPGEIGFGGGMLLIAILPAFLPKFLVGSFVGTRLRLSANNEYIIRVIKILLSLLAIHMVIRVLLLQSG
ncbi:hypothetical protein [Vibrio mangrovi]|uniref:Urease accessory protein UreH-like transmembrane domain-containing protein n=1 Tax=Vibrio mangrovi TaxID=474394 RepID=A0ABU4IAN5_9VIBR|nr:hypothetical protein [Vibrio mangrovi]MDW6004801.1 hypothetical protein [Vibrio mangrovi]